MQYRWGPAGQEAMGVQSFAPWPPHGYGHLSMLPGCRVNSCPRQAHSDGATCPGTDRMAQARVCDPAGYSLESVLTEGLESGRIRQFGELVYPRGTAGSNPAPSANACARWGASGPLHPQPATVEPKGFRREKARRSVLRQVVLRVEPSAAHVGESRQARKGAAVS